ncbi:hypothetical protein F751_3720 [Auxenochlorella protothecoides]|nr:hypothetical protein F751_3720 [Auxenochlorella protothecoides]KFM29103.1 hypothetical protein F751_3720 [Auxenochlorella protothecoides]RMZ52354.1 hypothetical protein APUTEX25_000629 [Auxenochlorella protothecoides]|eukprot:RMZ52354.1 hypothetical protein APUTEX25_000629 [Auxenochlorella protothecoides]
MRSGFQEATSQAPTVRFEDEVDGVVPETRGDLHSDGQTPDPRVVAGVSPAALDFVEVDAYCKMTGASLYVVSAKTGQGVTELFHGIVQAGAAASRASSIHSALDSRVSSIQSLQSQATLTVHGGDGAAATLAEARGREPASAPDAPASTGSAADLREFRSTGQYDANFANSPWHGEYVFDEDGLIAAQVPPGTRDAARAAGRKQACRVT